MLNKSAQQGTGSNTTGWVRSDELVQHPSGLIIMTNEQLYLLRVTRKGKLILPK